MSTLPKSIDATVTEVSELVKPFLGASDTWRFDGLGLPEVEDMVIALGRLHGTYDEQHVKLAVDFSYGEWTVSEPGWGSYEGTGIALSEAILDLLHDTVRRVCPACRSYDGHDSTCTELLSDDVDEGALDQMVQARLATDPEYRNAEDATEQAEREADITAQCQRELSSR